MNCDWKRKKSFSCRAISKGTLSKQDKVFQVFQVFGFTIGRKSSKKFWAITSVSCFSSKNIFPLYNWAHQTILKEILGANNLAGTASLVYLEFRHSWGETYKILHPKFRQTLTHKIRQFYPKNVQVDISDSTLRSLSPYWNNYRGQLQDDNY